MGLQRPCHCHNNTPNPKIQTGGGAPSPKVDSTHLPFAHNSMAARIVRRSLLLSPQHRAYAQTRSTKPRMDTSLKYTPERGDELRANVDEVLKEIDSVKPAGSSVSARPDMLTAASPCSHLQDQAPKRYPGAVRRWASTLWRELHPRAGREGGYCESTVYILTQLPTDINWHFVGSLQSNKSKLLTSIPNLYVLETLSTTKLADLLQKSLPQDRTLRVYLQVNTSGEDSKSGLPLPPDSALLDLASHVRDKCPNLTVAGLMTIGSWEASHGEGENPDFMRLKAAREVMQAAGFEGLELSMGMSADFCEAVKEGSSSVRVGTRIFGARPKKQ